MSRTRRIFIEISLVLTVLTGALLLFSTTAAAQDPSVTPKQDTVSKNTAVQPNKPAAPAAVAPVYKEFMGVTLGMSAADIREKLGHLKNKGERQDFFVFSDSQTAQIVYDAEGKATTISVDYIGMNSQSPTPESVLGEPVQAKPDGSAFQLKRYPEAGYWVAYSRTAGDNPTVTVTMQKI